MGKDPAGRQRGIQLSQQDEMFDQPDHQRFLIR